MLCLALWNGEVDGAVAVARRARSDLSEGGLIFADVLVQGDEQLLSVLGGHDDARLHASLRRVGSQQNHVQEKVVGAVGDHG